jgi:Fur family transcriptional regulator, stress-responsive regulator
MPPLDVKRSGLEPNQLAEELRSRGLRVTAPRLAVYRAVADTPGHPDVESIAATARKSLGALSTQAVYDALAALTEAGLLRRVEPARSPARVRGTRRR